MDHNDVILFKIQIFLRKHAWLLNFNLNYIQVIEVPYYKIMHFSYYISYKFSLKHSNVHILIHLAIYKTYDHIR
jgi:hypothetical protein